MPRDDALYERVRLPRSLSRGTAGLRRRIALLLPIVVVLFAIAPTAEAHHPDHLACSSDQISQGRRVLRNCAHADALEIGELGARDFLEHHALELGLQDGGADLVILEEKHGLASVRTHFQQYLDGLPVYGHYTTLNQTSDGTFLALYLKHRMLAAGDPVPSVSEGEAEVIARANADVLSTRLATQSELVWYPLANGTARLAWKSMIYSAEPLGDFLTLVDAHSGKILLQENRINFVDGSGLTYIPNPVQTSANTALTDNADAASAALDAERVSVTLQGLDEGVGTLKGEFVDLVSLAGGKAVPDADEVTRVYEYDRDDDRFEQVVIYHSIDQIQRYFHSLGFDDDVGSANGIRDFPSLANAHWYDQDQSFYSTGDDAVHFGDGGVDDGEDADIIAHEYGHAVQHDQNVCWGGGEMGAMGEAFGDYLAASFYASSGDATYQSSNAACVGEWDATAFSSSNPPCLRRVDGTKTYPDDLTGSVHADGEIWSRALWDIRTALGGTTADQLVLEHHFNVPCNASMPDAAAEFIQADVNLNSGVNGNAIRLAFCDRGILSGAACVAPADLNLSQTVSPDPPVAGQNATYTIEATNVSNGTLSAIQLSALVPAGSTFVGASDSGSETGGTISWPAFDLISSATLNRSFEIAVGPGSGSSVVFVDDMESGASNWSATHDASYGNFDWSLGTTNPHQKTSNVQPKAAAAATCTGGVADIYPCENVDLLTYIPIGDLGGGSGSDGWGWTDPQDGTEYVLMGQNNGTSFIDISDPVNPVHVGTLPTHSVNSDWRDIKVYADHAFIVSEAANHGLQIFDLTQLGSVVTTPATFSNTAHYAGFTRAHNIAINTDSATAYIVGAQDCSGGLLMLDITDPLSPALAGCYSDDGYTHDVECVIYSGPDTAHTGNEICFASNEDTLTIIDVTTKASPVELSRTTYAGSGYSHQAWLTDDQQYLLMDDELDEQNNSHNTRTYVWDVSSLAAPTIVGNHTSHLPVIDHNLYVVGDFVYQANYEAGLRILKIEDLAQADLCEVASFDVYPASNNAQFNGSWNVYPFFASGVVAINAIEGLALVQPQLGSVACATDPPGTEYAWFASDPSSQSDQYLSTASSHTVTGNPTLSFWHDYNTENSYDGGVVEYSTDDGVSWTDLESLITTNGYSGVISGSFSNPLANRNAFEGASGGYLQTVADLSSLSGQDIRIRFRMASDTSVSGTGWYVDDVEISSIVAITSVATATGGASATHTLTSNVAPPSNNNAPSLVTNAGLSLLEAATAPITSSELETTDADAGQTLTYSVTSAPANGSLNLGSSFTQAQINASALEYTHDGGETTNDAFTFTVSDGSGGSISSTVFAITITPSNDPPVAVADSLNVDEGGTATTLTGGATSVLTNDTDAENDPLTAVLVSGPSNGSLTLNSNGTFSYTHDAGQTVSDSFSYSANDGSVNSNPVSVSISVNPVNDPPVAVADALNVDEGGTATTLTGGATSVLSKDKIGRAAGLDTVFAGGGSSRRG
ncbi:MAG: choice-of-anchor B family protein, partial [Myxococcota bacterium]|nr:choice-of-anchor B family protein [Myxococcota bacterium]